MEVNGNYIKQYVHSTKTTGLIWCFVKPESYRMTEYHLLKTFGEKPNKNRLTIVILRSVVCKVPSFAHLRAEV